MLVKLVFKIHECFVMIPNRCHLLSFQDGSYLAELLLSKGYEVSERSCQTPPTAPF